MIAAAAAPERPNPGVSLTIINGNWAQRACGRYERCWNPPAT